MESRVFEVIKRKCCGTIFAACWDGHQDEEWYKEVKEATKKGHTVELISSVRFKFSECICNYVDPNQLNLFS